MKIVLNKKSVVPVVAREILQHTKVCVMDGDLITFEVERFIDFVQAVYRAFAKLSRQSEEGGYSAAVYMRLPVIVSVNGISYFLIVEDNALRYGRL